MADLQEHPFGWMARFAARAPHREGLLRPFASTLAGRPVSVATDGKTLVMVEGAHFEPHPKSMVIDSVVQPTETAPVATLPLLELRAWCGPAVASGPELEAAKCDVCHGNAVHYCNDCGDEHDCGGCKGSGVRGEPIRWGRVGGSPVNRLRLGEALARLPGSVAGGDAGVQVGTHAPGLVFARGAGWLIVAAVSVFDADECPDAAASIAIPAASPVERRPCGCGWAPHGCACEGGCVACHPMEAPR